MKRSQNLHVLMVAAALLCAASALEDKGKQQLAKASLATVDTDLSKLNLQLASTPAEGRPACNAANAGKVWPVEASDPHFAEVLSAYGYPMICKHVGATYVWHSTVAPRNPQRASGESTKH